MSLQSRIDSARKLHQQKKQRTVNEIQDILDALGSCPSIELKMLEDDFIASIQESTKQIFYHRWFTLNIEKRLCHKLRNLTKGTSFYTWIRSAYNKCKDSTVQEHKVAISDFFRQQVSARLTELTNAWNKAHNDYNCMFNKETLYIRPREKSVSVYPDYDSDCFIQYD